MSVLEKWRHERTYVSVEVRLDEFLPESLLQGLIECKWITEEEALAIMNRATAKEKAVRVLSATGIDDDELLTAEIEFRAGRRFEGITHLERALGREWIGRLLA